jgi:hypothetical protein
MKKIVFLVIAVLLVLSLAGCGGGSGDEDNNGNGNGNGDGNGAETAQWAAYAFGDTVEPKSGGSGKIDSFTIESAYNDEDGLRKFEIEGTYLGKETTQIKTQKMVTTTTPFSMTTENVTATLECYKVKHRVTVLQDDTGDTHPDWAEITLWIPTSDLETSTLYFWIYPKAEYVDSNGDDGEWSYYLTDAMQAEMDNPPAGQTVAYLPVAEGDFYGFDDWAFFGLYGWGWFWFKGFAEGGAQELKEGSWTAGGYGCSYNCSKVNKTIGSYTFSAWSLAYSCTGEGSTGGYEGIFSEDLPLPIYAKFSSSGGGTSTYWEYTLTDLELQ